MNPFPLFLNELSLSLQRLHQSEKVEVVLGFVKTLRAAKQIRHNIELHNFSPLYECDIGNGDYLCTILKGNLYIDQWRFIRSLAQKAPWDISGISIDIRFNEQKVTGIALARENQSASISLPSELTWRDNKIFVSVSGTVEPVPNLAAPAHVDYWHELLRNFGTNVSTSSVVFQDGDIKVHIFLKDHNPPHMHVQYSDGWAVINIHTLDVMEGHPPAHVSSYISRWAKQHQNELFLNWERCCAGIHPLLVGN